DVFQNTFVAVFTKIGQYEPGRPGRPWLYAIATNQAIDALRRKARRAERTVDPIAPAAGEGADDGRPLFDLLAAREADPADQAAAAETRRRVREAAAVETHLRAHPADGAKLDRLRRVLRPLEADRGDIDPPSGLVVATLARVAEHLAATGWREPARESAPADDTPTDEVPALPEV